ncbi:MAG: hypothetical protein ACRDY1_13440, partial [Acidimicrobiales bacterium]
MSEGMNGGRWSGGAGTGGHRSPRTARPSAGPAVPSGHLPPIPGARRRTALPTALAAALVVAGATGLLLASAATAAADPIGDCTTTVGVVVVVDFAAFGGNIERGCDASPTTGYNALYDAGFTTAGDERDGPTFICRIDDEPPPSQVACVTTPPADEYWSYWHADAGQNTWSYSALGAADYHPPPGSVDAWTFGATDIDGTTGQPTFAPSAVRATNTGVTPPSTTTTTTAHAAPTTTPTTVPPTSSGHGGQAGGSSPPVSVPSPAAAHAGATTTPSSTTVAPPPTSTTTTVVAPATGDKGRRSPLIVDASPATPPASSSGSPLPIVLGVVLAAVLGGAA